LFKKLPQTDAKDVRKSRGNSSTILESESTHFERGKRPRFLLFPMVFCLELATIMSVDSPISKMLMLPLRFGFHLIRASYEELA